MLPVLLDFKFIKIYTLGLFLVLAFFWGSFLLWKVIRLTSYKEEDIFDGLFYSIFGGLFIGRLVYIILNFKDFGFNFLKFILINGYPGISIFGMLVGGLLFLYLWSYIAKIKFIEVIDYFIPSLALAIAIGKLGTFLSGSEAGTKTKFILGVKYANMEGLRHLTPFYESILFLAVFFLTYRILFEIRKDRFSKGFNFAFLVWSSSLIYFVFDNLKQYHLYFFGQSFNKSVSGILLLTFSFYFVYYFRSLIRAKILLFKNFLIHYVKSSIKKFSRRTEKEDRRGTGKNPKAD